MKKIIILVLFIFAFTLGCTQIEETTDLRISNEYYTEVSEGFFVIHDIDDNIESSIKYFDFEYYNRLTADPELKNYYYIYLEDGIYYMQMVSKNYEELMIDVKLPQSEKYFFITDVYPTFTATLKESKGVTEVESQIINNNINRKYEEVPTGSDYNPPKILISFKRGNEDFASLIIENHAGIVLNEFEVKIIFS